jgi:uncharacterized membrane protein|tara:strand:+ start:10825 stop:11199 length:375 start_codon:yes stop_codon:yes gene_type:complete
LNTEAQKPEKYERRRGPDVICRAFSWLAVLGWLLFLVAMIIAHYAKPEMDTGLVRYWGIEIRDEWHPMLTDLLQYFLTFAALLSGLSLALNRLRLRRRSDHLHFNIVLLLISCLSLLLYLFWHT